MTGATPLPLLLVLALLLAGCFALSKTKRREPPKPANDEWLYLDFEHDTANDCGSGYLSISPVATIVHTLPDPEPGLTFSFYGLGVVRGHAYERHIPEDGFVTVRAVYNEDEDVTEWKDVE